jgi:hypothetical protein
LTSTGKRNQFILYSWMPPEDPVVSKYLCWSEILL